MFDLVKREGDFPSSNFGLTLDTKDDNDPLAPAMVGISLPAPNKSGKIMEQY